MIQFRTKQLTPGRPGPGTCVAIEVRTIDPSTGKFAGWACINYTTSNEPRGGHASAELLSGALQAVWDAYLDGTLTTSLFAFGYKEDAPGVTQKHPLELIKDGESAR